jgi:glucose-6-phosphate isomerase/transaldolase/glucose-6-phosphate isomerase
VIQRTFGTAPDWLELRVLDSTDPEAVAAAVDDLHPLATLFIVATKSGTTTEPLAFQADAWARIERSMKEARVGGSPGMFMAAITDPGKGIASIPHHDELREEFLNPADVGGRYSALTYVGLVPASLIGLDLDPFLASASAMLAQSSAEDHLENPALGLGLAIGTLAAAGRDKLTFVPDPEIAGFGMWAEQLLAESTGKQGVGIVPVDQEPLGAVAAYGPDRAFVRISLEGSAGAKAPDGRSADALIDDLAAAGHPVIRIRLADPMDLAGEFIRWEIATAIAGIVIGIDPFDQPNVEEAKENTRRLLARHGGAASEGAATADAESSGTGRFLAEGGLTLYPDTTLHLSSGDGTAAGELRRQLARLRPAGYVSLQAYFAPTAARDAALSRLRVLLRDVTRRATTAGYGPRFLHSTGQLHKGGPPIGWFLQLTADHPVDRPIPGWPYTFGQLIDAQAQGDFETLESHDLPVLRIHFRADPDAGLAALEALLVETVKEA